MHQHKLLLIAYKIVISRQEYGTKLKATEDTLELTNLKYFQTQSESMLQIKDSRPSSRDFSLFKKHTGK